MIQTIVENISDFDLTARTDTVDGYLVNDAATQSWIIIVDFFLVFCLRWHGLWIVQRPKLRDW